MTALPEARITIYRDTSVMRATLRSSFPSKILGRRRSVLFIHWMKPDTHLIRAWSLSPGLLEAGYTRRDKPAPHYNSSHDPLVFGPRLNGPGPERTDATSPGRGVFEEPVQYPRGRVCKAILASELLASQGVLIWTLKNRDLTRSGGWP